MCETTNGFGAAKAKVLGQINSFRGKKDSYSSSLNSTYHSYDPPSQKRGFHLNDNSIGGVSCVNGTLVEGCSGNISARNTRNPLSGSPAVTMVSMDHSYCQPSNMYCNIKTNVPLNNVVNHSETSEALTHFNEIPGTTSEATSSSHDLAYQSELCNSKDEVTVFEDCVVHDEPYVPLIMECEENKDLDFQHLCEKVTELPIMKLKKFHVISTDKSLQIVQLCKNDLPTVRLAIEIDKDFHCTIHLEREKLDEKHDILKDLPSKFRDENDVNELLSRLDSMNVCQGNNDLFFEELVDIIERLSKSSKEVGGKGYFDAVYAPGLKYSSTIRSTQCELLIDQSMKCRSCLLYSDVIQSRMKELTDKIKNQTEFNFTQFMNRFQLCKKIEEQQKEINELKTTLILRTVVKQCFEKENKEKTDKKTAAADEIIEFESLKDTSCYNITLLDQNMVWNHKYTDKETGDRITQKDTSITDINKTDSAVQPVEPASVFIYSHSSGATSSENTEERNKRQVKTKAIWYPESGLSLDGNIEGGGNILQVNKSVAHECKAEISSTKKKESTMDLLPQSVKEYEDFPNDREVSENGKYVDSLTDLLNTWDSLAYTKTKNRIRGPQSKYHLTSNHNRHSTGKSILCFICGKTYKNKVSLEDHLSDMHPDLNNGIKCPKCQKIFYSKKRFRSHIRVHLDPKKAKQYACEICNKTFRNKSSQNLHLKYVHTDTKLFECKLCQRTFKFQHSYKEHILTHTQSFYCDICGTSLKNKNSLRRHMQRHSDVKPHTCEVCGHGFIQKYAYWVHMEKHHDISRPQTSKEN